ncbi:hypothetical protein [Conyzicola nivalis]|nr:hypothetical protein [Conyzicola nivalis]
MTTTIDCRAVLFARDLPRVRDYSQITATVTGGRITLTIAG